MTHASSTSSCFRVDLYPPKNSTVLLCLAQCTLVSALLRVPNMPGVFNIPDQLPWRWQVRRARCHQTVTLSVLQQVIMGRSQRALMGFELAAGISPLFVSHRPNGNQKRGGHPVLWQPTCFISAYMTLQELDTLNVCLPPQIFH